MRSSILMILAGLVLAGCGGAPPAFTIPPLNLPSIPPLNLPSIPPINLPSLDINLPTLPPGGSTTGACALVSEAEMSSIVGQTMTVLTNSGTQCTWTSSTITPSVVIRYGTSETIAAAKMITSNGRDLTISGSPAYYGEFAGSLLFIDKGGRILIVQAVWSLTGDAAVVKVSQMGELAASRF